MKLSRLADFSERADTLARKARDLELDFLEHQHDHGEGPMPDDINTVCNGLREASLAAGLASNYTGDRSGCTTQRQEQEGPEQMNLQDQINAHADKVLVEQIHIANLDKRIESAGAKVAVRYERTKRRKKAKIENLEGQIKKLTEDLKTQQRLDAADDAEESRRQRVREGLEAPLVGDMAWLAEEGLGSEEPEPAA